MKLDDTRSTNAPVAILDKRADGIAILTLDRPDALNALNRQMVAEIRAAVRAVEADAAVNLLVLASSSARAFCAGIDLRERQEMKDEDVAVYREEELFPMYREIEAMAKPKIAAVAGHALAGGFELALAADLIVAAEDARFALAEVKWGVIPAAGGCHKLTRVLGPYRAKEYIFTAKAMTAAAAHGFGLVNEVVPVGRQLDAALALAGRVLGHSQDAVRRAKRCIDNAFGLQDTADFDLRMATEHYQSEARRQGMAKFKESS